MDVKFRNLSAEEIECRIAQVKTTGVSLLLYMDARAAAALLDDAVGAMNWQCSYRDIDGKMYCTVSIYDTDKNAWISKENVGTESNTEAEKGQASDALKRAVATWGVRELYTSPFIWIKSTDCKIEDGGKKCYDKFRVKSITIDKNKKITALTIENVTQGKQCFSWSITSMAKAKTATKAQNSVYVTQEQLDILGKVYVGDKLQKLLEANSIDDISKLPYAKAQTIIEKLTERLNNAS